MKNIIFVILLFGCTRSGINSQLTGTLHDSTTQHQDSIQGMQVRNVNDAGCWIDSLSIDGNIYLVGNISPTQTKFINANPPFNNVTVIAYVTINGANYSPTVVSIFTFNPDKIFTSNPFLDTGSSYHDSATFFNVTLDNTSLIAINHQ